MPCFHASNNIRRIKARRKTTLHACCCKFCHRRQASHSLPPDEKPVSVTVNAVLGTALSLHLGGRLRACRPLETPCCSRKLSSLSLVCPRHRPPQPPRGAGGRGRAGGAAVRLWARAAWNRSSLIRKVTPPGCGGDGEQSGWHVSHHDRNRHGPRRRPPPGRCTDHLGGHGPHRDHGAGTALAAALP